MVYFVRLDVRNFMDVGNMLNGICLRSLRRHNLEFAWAGRSLEAELGMIDAEEAEAGT